MPEHAAHSLHLHPAVVHQRHLLCGDAARLSRAQVRGPATQQVHGRAAEAPRRPARQPAPPHVPGQGPATSSFFESWLRHEVAANRTKAERISISFNYNWS
ncbi:MAG: putative 2OG-Fe(II) oxygenase [Lacunisphaera sp.]